MSVCSRFKWDDICILFQRSPTLERAFWGQEVFLAVSTKTPHGLCSSISQENSLYIGWGNFPPRTTSPIKSEHVPLCNAK
jgi:hypothetical protein